MAFSIEGSGESVNFVKCQLGIDKASNGALDVHLKGVLEMVEKTVE